MKATVLIGTIGVAFGGMVGYHTFYVPKVEQARLIEQQRAQAQTDYQDRSEVAALLTKVEQYRKRVSPDADPSWLSREVVAMARDSGLELTTITPNQSPLDPSSVVSRPSVSLQFTATYHQLAQFLNALEQSDTFFHVDQLQLTSLASTSEYADREGHAQAPGSVQLMVSTLYVPTPTPQHGAHSTP